MKVGVVLHKATNKMMTVEVLPREIWSEVYHWLLHKDRISLSIVSKTTYNVFKQFVTANQWSLSKEKHYYHNIYLSNVVLGLLRTISQPDTIKSPDWQSARLATAIYAVETTKEVDGTCLIITKDDLETTFARIGLVPATSDRNETTWQVGLNGKVVTCGGFTRHNQNIHTTIALGEHPIHNRVLITVTVDPSMTSPLFTLDETTPLYYKFYEYSFNTKVEELFLQAIADCKHRTLAICRESNILPKIEGMTYIYHAEYKDDYEHFANFDSYILIDFAPQMITHFSSLCWRSGRAKRLIVIGSHFVPIPVPTHVISEAFEAIGRNVGYRYGGRRVGNVCGLSYAELALVGPISCFDQSHYTWARSVLGRELRIGYNHYCEIGRRDQPPLESYWLKLNPNQNAADTPAFFALLP